MYYLMLINISMDTKVLSLTVKEIQRAKCAGEKVCSFV